MVENFRKNGTKFLKNFRVFDKGLTVLMVLVLLTTDTNLEQKSGPEREVGTDICQNWR